MADTKILLVCDALVTAINAKVKPSHTEVFEVDSQVAFSMAFDESELVKLRVTVAPDDLTRVGPVGRAKDSGETQEEQLYDVRIGVQQMVQRTNVTAIRKRLNVAVAILNMWPKNYKVSLDDGGNVTFLAARPAPLFFRSSTVMDVVTPKTPFQSFLIFTFSEYVTITPG